MRRLPIIKMSGTVIRSLLRGSACKMYPRRPPAFFSGTRGPVEIDAASCVLCGLCAQKCPGKALVVDRAQKTWRIDRLKCLVCGVCVEVCPKKSLSQRTGYTAPVTAKSTETFSISPTTPTP